VPLGLTFLALHGGTAPPLEIGAEAIVVVGDGAEALVAGDSEEGIQVVGVGSLR